MKSDEKDFTYHLEVRPGYYWLITGNRLADGTVLVRCSLPGRMEKPQPWIWCCGMSPEREQPGRMVEVELQTLAGQEAAPGPTLVKRHAPNLIELTGSPPTLCGSLGAEKRV